MPTQLTSEADVDAGMVEGDWQLVQTSEWWQTPFAAVSWAYVPEKQIFKRQTSFSSNLHLPRHEAEERTWQLKKEDDADVSLNPDLVGVQATEAVLLGYEKDVGFFYTLFPSIEPEDLGRGRPLNLSFDEDELVAYRERWAEVVDDLVNNVAEPSMTDSEGSLSSSVTESIPSGSEASNDFFAMPATPVSKTSYASILLKNVSPSSSISSVISEEQPLTTPSKGLNAFASSFVPTFSPPPKMGAFTFPSISDSYQAPESPSSSPTKKSSTTPKSTLPSLTKFTFPTLNPPTKSTTRLTTVKIRKDEQGFFTDVQVEKPPNTSAEPELETSSLLPSFLKEPTPRRRGRTSKTREIVDRLRSTQSQTSDDSHCEAKKPDLDFNFDLFSKSASVSPTPALHDLTFETRLSVSDDGGDHRDISGHSTPSQDDEDEGWIDVAQMKTSASGSSDGSKAKRARDLFLAFTRRRTDSIHSEQSKEDSTTATVPSQEKASKSSSTSTIPSTFTVSPNSEGWIEGLGSPNEGQTASTKGVQYSTTTATKTKGHRKRHSHKRSTSGSISSTSPTHSNFGGTPFMNIPLVNPTQLNMLAPSSTTMPFFFNPAASPYHPGAVPMPVAYGRPGYLPPPSYAPVHPTHGMTTPMTPFAIPPTATNSATQVKGVPSNQHHHYHHHNNHHRKTSSSFALKTT